MIPTYLKFDYEIFNDNQLKKILSTFKPINKIKVLYISTYASEYTRTETILNLMDRNKIQYKSILVGESRLKYFQALKALIKNQENYDVIFVGFRGQETLPFLKMFATKPIIFDAFISVYDTLCFDRKLFSPQSFVGKLLKKYDELLIRMSATVLVDTKAHKKYFEKEFKAKNISFLYVGCNKNIFKPSSIPRINKKFTIFWYGHANPLQGVETILKTAKNMEDRKDIVFRLVGPIKKKYAGLINQLDLKNVQIIDFIEYKKLAREINMADVCLGGHFSNISKAKRVIAGKTFQFLACNKKTIVADNLGNNELFKEDGIKLFISKSKCADLERRIMEIKNG